MIKAKQFIFTLVVNIITSLALLLIQWVVEEFLVFFVVNTRQVIQWNINYVFATFLGIQSINLRFSLRTGLAAVQKDYFVQTKHEIQILLAVAILRMDCKICGFELSTFFAPIGWLFAHVYQQTCIRMASHACVVLSL